ncbi:bifunctional phosphopantothenoylcysteine decarboxylase/phosphopantothenate--cysteine ligase CoaBC [Arcanobacterium ihumii]|uniref:bifunctional phosphopantothenoylcysteine decarboxylase/phosphopantothenate--cysteine ligase CoaBC n=1 Tax=Arcanobacterium ihumii TaxID=2138162 RepID=UPI000F538245|nr:bifunctional phosphopantothenoylcysteine decarboxylase/phosphopantothenate--cysteine ligase CoaBC [Arcanobacterium ihumii]
MGGLIHIQPRKSEARKIVVGVTGGIAAYKAATLVRLFKKAGHDVRVVPTHAALSMVGATTFEALSGNPVFVDVTDDAFDVVHVNTGQQADLVVIAPTTAHTMAKIANGMADNLLTATVLVATCPIVLAPAMHTEMWNNPATQVNARQLERRGFHFVGPVRGALTGPDTGIGRMAEPEEIFDYCCRVLANNDEASRGKNPSENNAQAEDSPSLAGRTVLVTGGGTREPIDSVRYISNRSSGSMAINIANNAALAGANVIFISANIERHRLEQLNKSISVHEVETARDLQTKVNLFVSEADAVVMTAAVSDYRVETPSETKMKRENEEMSLKLVANPDILADIAHNRRRTGQVIVGFAAETGDSTTSYLEFGKRKAQRKNADLLAINLVGQNVGFGDVETRLTVVNRQGEVLGDFEGSKAAVARELIVVIASLMNGQ